jgi:hypothetical protein
VKVTKEEWATARRMWPCDEDADFSVTITMPAQGQEDCDTVTAPVVDGTSWLVLSCSVHGRVMAASTSWELGALLTAAERHYVLRHLRPRSVKAATGTGQAAVPCGTCPSCQAPYWMPHHADCRKAGHHDQ